MKEENSKSDFNFFKFLKLERKETISSQFIVSIMKENRNYLKSFLQIVGHDGFINCEKCTISTEVTLKYRTSKKEYGRADIWIGHKENEIYKRIIIENKLFAGDQNKQIGRYRNYLQEGNREGRLFYLTLEGKPASSNSAKNCNNNLYSSNDAVNGYQTISYHYHIIPWLEEIEKTAKPELKELINYYIAIIDEFTYIQKEIHKGKSVSEIERARQAEFRAALELHFWNTLENEIENKFREFNKEVLFDSRRKFNYDKIYKHQKNQSFGNSYGLISGHLRLGVKVVDKTKSLIMISNGSFNSDTNHWEIVKNRNYQHGELNLKGLENIFNVEKEAKELAEKFCNMY